MPSLSAIGSAVVEIWNVTHGYMEMHCQLGAYMHAKFRRNRRSNYRVIAIATKLTPLRFLDEACALGFRGHPHASTIVQYLVGGMKLSYKKYRK